VAAERAGQLDAGVFFGLRIHHANQAATICCDDRDLSTGQEAQEPLLVGSEPAFAIMFMKRQLDGGLKLLFAERLQNISVRLRVLGALERPIVGECGYINDGNVEARLEDLGGLDTIDAALELDVHQDEVRPCFRRAADGILTGGHHAWNRVSKFLQVLLDVGGDKPFVFDY
jgi:hypothetical protein